VGLLFRYGKMPPPGFQALNAEEQELKSMTPPLNGGLSWPGLIKHDAMWNGGDLKEVHTTFVSP